MFNELRIVLWILIAFLAIAFWESSIEGRDSWHKKKVGWKIKIGKKVILTRYHFFLFYIMVPVFLSLPLVIFGWNAHLFGILLTAYFLGLIVEDFFWYIFNPNVKLKEFWSPFSDYYPWVRIAGKKIIPVYYLFGIIAAILSVYIFCN